MMAQTRAHLVTLLESRPDIFDAEHIILAKLLNPKDKATVKKFHQKLEDLRRKN